MSAPAGVTWDTSVLWQETLLAPQQWWQGREPPLNPQGPPCQEGATSCQASHVSPLPPHQPGWSLTQQSHPRRGPHGWGTWPHLPTRDCQVLLQQGHGVRRHHVALGLVVLSCGQRTLRAAALPKPS